MRQLMRDAHTELLRGVRRVLEGDSRLGDLFAPGSGLPSLTVTGVAAERWASAVFSGQRHTLDLTLRGPLALVSAGRDAITSSLPGAEFDLRDHLVAGIAMIEAETRTEGGETLCEMRFEALTVED